MNDNDLLALIRSEDYDNNGITLEVPVTFLLRHVVGSCDFNSMDSPEDWEHMLAYKSGDSGFPSLLDSIMEHGLIEDAPIGICYSDWREGIKISEGHHRLTAAILLCKDTVFISAYGRGGCPPNGKRISAHHDYKQPRGGFIEYDGNLDN